MDEHETFEATTEPNYVENASSESFINIHNEGRISSYDDDNSSQSGFKVEEEETQSKLVSDIGGKVFTCEKCDKKLSTRGGLSRHHASFHEGANYFCDTCDYIASRKDHLKIHSIKYHKLQ